MFGLLLLVTLIIALLVCILLARFFDKPIATILDRIVKEDISSAWQRYIRFAIYVVGISGGVRIWQLEKYITARTQVYRVQAVGYFDGGGPTARVEAVIDTNLGRPRIVSWRDLTELGKGFDLPAQQP